MGKVDVVGHAHLQAEEQDLQSKDTKLFNLSCVQTSCLTFGVHNTGCNLIR